MSVVCNVVCPENVQKSMMLRAKQAILCERSELAPVQRDVRSELQIHGIVACKIHKFWHKRRQCSWLL